MKIKFSVVMAYLWILAGFLYIFEFVTVSPNILAALICFSLSSIHLLRDQVEGDK